MAEARITNVTFVEEKRDPELWAQWKARRAKELEDLAGGAGRISETVEIKKTEKVVMVSDDRQRGTDMFLGVTHSSTVTIDCPQTEKAILKARRIATELALEDAIGWMEYIEDEVLEYVKQKKLGGGNASQTKRGGPLSR